MSKEAQIWHTIQLIPPGNVASYGQLADLAGLPGRARMVGRALRNAPDGMALPWHRVLRSSGELAFPKGSEHAKEQASRLWEEGVPVVNHRVKMKEFQWVPDITELLFRLQY